MTSARHTDAGGRPDLRADLRAGRRRRGGQGTLATAGLVLVLGLAGCAGVPGPATAPEPAATVAPAVAPEQAEHVRGEVAARLLAARVAGDPALVDQAATGPAALLERARVAADGPLPDASAEQPVPATVLLAPQEAGWPRWFATVTDPAATPAPAPGGDVADPGSAPAEPERTTAPVVQELPVLELYTAEQVRLPYRLWARLTLLPGAELPAFPAAEVGAVPLAGGPAPGPLSSAGADPTADDGSPADGDPPTEDEELLAATTGLASRYASVLADGDASPYAAQFQPDPFVAAVRTRVAAETAAVASVAGTSVEFAPLDGAEVLYAARAADGDLLAVTAVETTTTMTVRPGSGVLRPGPELRAATGVEETTKGVTVRSVVALAFVVPAERGALRLVAVGDGLVSASAP